LSEHFSSARARMRSFGDDTRGAIAILFALLAIPFFGIAGIAIDYGRALKVRAAIQTAADSASSAAVKRLGEGREAVDGAIRAGMQANLASLDGVSYRYNIIGENQGVNVELETTVPTTLARIFGHEKFEVRAESSAERPKVAAVARTERNSSAPPVRADKPVSQMSDDEKRRIVEEVTRRLQEMARRGGPTRGEIEELRSLMRQ